MSFVHLHNHTHFSLLDGLTKIDELIEKAKSEGSPAVAITDHGVLYGAIEFYQKCKKTGIKPIIGVETYVAPRSRFDKLGRSDAKNYHLILWAENNTGYHNLIELISAAHLEGYYYKPRVDWDLLTRYHEGVIAASACLGGELAQMILAGDEAGAKKRAQEYNELFGQGNYYLEIMDHPELEGQAKVNETLIRFSKELNIPLVATNDVHYLKKEDAEAQDILLCLQNKKKLADKDRMSMFGMGDYSFRSVASMKEAFKDTPEAILNTLKIADRCNVEIDLGHTQLPHFEVPAGFDGDSYLRHLSEEGIAERYPGLKLDSDAAQPILERMNYELSVIAKMGWPDYFLIVADFVNWAKDNGIVVGPGRGSAAGSLVCFLIGITNIDPLKYNLLFERFLNPDRISMPDIDMDFSDVRRNDVLAYVSNKYGSDHVAQIITFGTMAARAAVRDVGRVLDYPYDFCDGLSKAIPMFTKLPDAIKNVPELKERYNTEPDVRKVLDYALRLEGISRHSSTHACGVVITRGKLTDYTPIQYVSASDKSIVSQYSANPLESLGLLKMDFLGLKNLTIIESALKIIKNTRGLKIDIETIPLDDEATYKLFQNGETTGVFQFESSGMKRYLKDLKPTEFEDIIAMVALYRPGPMEWIPDFIKGKHGEKKVTYLHPKLEPILKNTHGVAIYQEQVMQIARDLAGFSMGQADVLRKAMGKKISALLAEQKEKFIDGCVKNGIYQELAEKVFSFIEPFAGYGFNRSHAACYALIGYQTAYLKAHWPVEFMAALLTSDQHDNDRIAIEIEECRNMGIKIMPPDVNQSFASFTVVTPNTATNQAVAPGEVLDTIRFGLNAVKNVGEHIVEVIISERKERGPYRDLFDFLERITDKDLNKKSLESLIKCGALESWGERGYLLSNSEKLLNFNKEIIKEKASRQDSLFVSLGVESFSARITLDNYPPAGQEEKLSWEKELLGLYVSEHPFNLYKNRLLGYAVPLVNLSGHRGERSVVTAGVINTIKKIITKNNESMLFVKIEDAVASVELLIFPRLLKETETLWVSGRPIICEATVSEKDQDIKLLVNTVAALDPDNLDASIDNFKRAVLAQRENNGNGSWRRNNYRRADNKASTTPAKTTPAPTAPVAPPAAATTNQVPLKILFEQVPAAEELEDLKKILATYPGESETLFKIKQPNKDTVIKTGLTVNISSSLEKAIIEKFTGRLKIV
ncbi:MAG: DNA polymerase III subunit alpha [Candidatus Parcubacteria bacterium]|nr:MAG: DNA polymerase III subunit alpha [Candidatus Parcubacteria bacterium]